MGKISDLLDGINVADENTSELYEIFRMVKDFDFPVIRFVIYSGYGLIRQRVNKKGEDFDKVSELNYPPYDCVTGYERANVPYQPMFYACSFPADYDEENTPPPRVVSLQETSSFYRDKAASGIERSTVSRWEVVKDLELVALPFLADYTMACKDIKTIKDDWNKAVKANTLNQDELELVEYMAREIGRTFSNNVEYFKIANFVNYLLNVNEKTKGSDGIIYPSVPAAGSGFNVAIKPSVVDEKIRFVGASLSHLLKKGEESYLHIVNKSISVENGHITYQENTMSDEEKKMYQTYAKGLVMRN